MRGNPDRASTIKILELLFFATQCPSLLRALSLADPLWYGAGVFFGAAVGYWIPPLERWMSFWKWLAWSLLLGLIGFLLSRFVHVHG